MKWTEKTPPDLQTLMVNSTIQDFIHYIKGVETQTPTGFCTSKVL